jgi:uncharacterized membrane protein YgdD (TMEM256/DUF423 family)
VLGAFGAHALADTLTPKAAATWDTAVQYQLVHALALCLVGGLMNGRSGTMLRVAGWSFGIGVLLFSGSLYLLSLGGPRLLGPVTPIGGAAFILGWIALAFSARSGSTG